MDVSYVYQQVYNMRDSRVDQWLLMDSPLPTIGIVIAYLAFVKQGMKFMKDKPAFDLKQLITVYNFFLVILSCYMVFQLILNSWLAPGFSWSCQPVDYSDNPHSLRLAKVLWWFYFSKIIELMDTVFFVLRKKNNQVSFLHVYHHSTMPLLWWIGIKFVAGGEAYFSATLNSFIHVLMYSYYMLSAMGPAMAKYLWWKKYMTSLQLIQFLLIMFKTAYGVYLDCGFPLVYGYALVAYATSHFALFSNFYYQTYTKAKANKLKKEELSNGTDNNNGEIDSYNLRSKPSPSKTILRKQRRLDN